VIGALVCEGRAQSEVVAESLARAAPLASRARARTRRGDLFQFDLGGGATLARRGGGGLGERDASPAAGPGIRRPRGAQTDLRGPCRPSNHCPLPDPLQ
jgi:hypothetical protein